MRILNKIVELDHTVFNNLIFIGAEMGNSCNDNGTLSLLIVDEVRKWLESYIGLEDVDWMFNGVLAVIDDEIDKIFPVGFLFHNEEDAMAFKLKFL